MNGITVVLGNERNEAIAVWEQCVAVPRVGDEIMLDGLWLHVWVVLWYDARHVTVRVEEYGS